MKTKAVHNIRGHFQVKNLVHKSHLQKKRRKNRKKKWLLNQRAKENQPRNKNFSKNGKTSSLVEMRRQN